MSYHIPYRSYRIIPYRIVLNHTIWYRMILNLASHSVSLAYHIMPYDTIIVSVSDCTMALSSLVLWCAVLCCAVLCCAVLQCEVHAHCIPLHPTTSHYIPLHLTTSHCTTLHLTTSHYSTLRMPGIASMCNMLTDWQTDWTLAEWLTKMLTPLVAGRHLRKCGCGECCGNVLKHTYETKIS